VPGSLLSLRPLPPGWLTEPEGWSVEVGGGVTGVELSGGGSGVVGEVVGDNVVDGFDEVTGTTGLSVGLAGVLVFCVWDVEAGGWLGAVGSCSWALS
jgi:hypothetical protein